MKPGKLKIRRTVNVSNEILCLPAKFQLNQIIIGCPVIF